MRRMSSGMVFEQRQIFMTNVIFSNGEGSKPRPVLVISNNNHNNSYSELVCCPITSNEGAEGRIITPGDYEVERKTLPFPQSVIKTKHMITVHKSKLNLPKNGRIKVNKQLVGKVIEDVLEILKTK